MTENWKDLQHININQTIAPCEKCGADITDIANFAFDGEISSEPLYREEKCKCKQSENTFILHYDLFDSDGHIFSRVFTEDVNNPFYNWQDVLSDSQKKAISEHLKACKICQERLSQEILDDAWFSNFLNTLRKKRSH